MRRLSGARRSIRDATIALATVLPLASCTSSTPVSTLHQSQAAYCGPPDQPPSADIEVVSNGRVIGKATGLNIYSQWLIEGRLETKDNSTAPVHWPQPVAAAPEDSVQIRVYARSPSRVEIRIWTDVSDRGVPTGRVSEVVSTGPTETIDGCTITSQHSIVVIRNQLPDGISYLSVNAYWVAVRGGYSWADMAVWLFRVNGRVDAAR